MNRAEKRRLRKLSEKTARNRKAGRTAGSIAEPPTLAVQQALKIAVQHHAAGRLPEAERIYKELLRADPQQPTAMHLLGVINHQRGHNNGAVDLITKALAIKPDYAEAHNNLGNALRDLGKLGEAVASFRKALALKPDYAEAHNNLGNALRDLGKLDEAVASCGKALALKPDYANAHNNLGTALQALGKLDEAVTSYGRALTLKPDYANAHNNLGTALQALGKLDEAVASYGRALALKPDYAEAHNNLGISLRDLGKLDDAITCYHKALAINPDYAEAHQNLCETLEDTNSTEALREAVNKALRNCPGNPRLTLGEARLLKRDGDYAAAREVLEAAGEEISEGRFMGARAHLLGDLCDRLGDAKTAYSYFEEGNRLRSETPEAKRADGSRYLARIDVLEKRFTSDWVAGWRHLESGNDRSDPVFLVGFPRSGTTLLDTILRSHRAITVVEEKPTLIGVRDALLRLPGSDPDGLAELDPGHLAELRQIYFTEIDKYLEPEDRSALVVDKLPLNITEAGLIHRIFPRARFLFAQRHPCDCVLSCFMQNFKINNAMANFLDLEDAAILYDKVMTLWQQYQTVLPLGVYTVRYESLIESFEETLTPLLDFLGVGWDDGIRDYTETAARRGRISTPSYNQVTQPLYTRSRGRWERYCDQMQPVLPLLLPWAEDFGYGE